MLRISQFNGAKMLITTRWKSTFISSSNNATIAPLGFAFMWNVYIFRRIMWRTFTYKLLFIITSRPFRHCNTNTVFIVLHIKDVFFFWVNDHFLTTNMLANYVYLSYTRVFFIAHWDNPVLNPSYTNNEHRYVDLHKNALVYHAN